VDSGELKKALMGDLKDDLKGIVKEAFEEQRKNFWVEAERHYKDHEQLTKCRESKEEWMANHHWVTEVRMSSQKIKETSLIAMTRIFWGAMLAILAYSFSQYFTK